MNKFWHHLANLSQRNLKMALCTVTKTKGSTPGKIGDKMMVFEDGSIYGTVGGGGVEKKIIEQALTQLQNGSPVIHKHDLLHHHNMCCGGNMEIFIEPIMNSNQLYIFGAGHTGSALAKLCNSLNFEVFVFDTRREYLDIIHSSEIETVHIKDIDSVNSIPFTPETYIVILTHEHGLDREILSICLNKPHKYLGMIGSKRKVEITRKMFLQSGIADEETLDLVDMPIGMLFPAHGPDEIAISIASKLIEVKNTEKRLHSWENVLS